jgi:hypothetical protein
MTLISNLMDFIKNFEIDNRNQALIDLGINLTQIGGKIRLVGQSVHIQSNYSFCGLKGALLYDLVSSSPDRYELYFFIDDHQEVYVSKEELKELSPQIEWQKSTKRLPPTGSSASCIHNDFAITFCSKDSEFNDAYKLDTIILRKLIR